MKIIKNLGKQQLIICILSLLLVITGILCINLNKEATYWKNETAIQNMNNWATLSMLADLYNGDSDIAAAIEGESLFTNGVLYSSLDDLTPAFPNRFLTLQYDPFIRDIPKFEGEAKEEALQLLIEMNSKLLEICIYVDDNFNNVKSQMELLNLNSDSHKTVEKKIQDFCDTYKKKIQDFYDNNTYIGYDAS